MKNIMMRIAVGVLCVATVLGISSGCKKESDSSGSAIPDLINSDPIISEPTTSEDAVSDPKTSQSTPGSSDGKNNSSSVGGFSSRVKLTYPTGQYVFGGDFEAKWSGGKAGQTYTLKLEKQNGSGYTTIAEKKGLTASSYKYPGKLENGYYRIHLQATAPDGTVREASNTKNGGLVFRCYATTNKEVNNGIDYRFDGSISEAVLNNYLNRACTYSIHSGMGAPSGFNDAEVEEGLRAILSVGAKYVPRAIAVFYPSVKYDEKYYSQLAEKIKLAHSVDPDIIFEACMFECVGSSLVSEIKIPDYVFEAFGQKKENRSFDGSKMFFQDGYNKDHFGEGTGTPDITRVETQMFFYYRATRYIDMGIESFHMGIMGAIGKNDTDHKCWEKVITKIRQYAAKKARRHYVLINGHAGNSYTGSDGANLVDFIASPSRLFAADGQTEHAPSANNPQKADIYPGRQYTWGDAHPPYNAVGAGKSPSGWSTEHYPYLVELDNWGVIKTNDLTLPRDLWNGYDEISWYANQPESYRHEFLYYITNKIKNYNENGHFAMPGVRTVYMVNQKKEIVYRMNSTKFCKEGFGDEDAIIAAWKKNK